MKAGAVSGSWEAEACSCCPETCFFGGRRQTSCSKAAAEGGRARWAGGGIWGTAIMRLTSDSCTASPLPRHQLLQPSCPGTGRGDDLVLRGHAERRRGAGSALEASEDAATLPSRDTEAGGARGLLMSLRESEPEPGWDPGQG